MADDKDIEKEEETPALAAPLPLPMREDTDKGVLEHTPPGKDISETFGGRIMHFFTFYVVGFFMNSALSLGITYFLNPQPGVKKFKDWIISGLRKFTGSNISDVQAKDSVRTGVEMSFMLVSGTLVTILMAPLVKYRGILAHKLNKLFKKDTDVLPEELQPVPEPKTVEDKIEQEINKRVKKHSAWDVWLPRISMTGVILFGDNRVNKLSRWLESKNRPSVDTLSWGLGKQIYTLLHKSSLGKKMIESSNRFFSSHGASIEAIRKSEPGHSERLKQHGDVDGENSMVVAEQTRLVVKELGWTLIMAKFMEFLTHTVRDLRIHRGEKKVIEDLTRQGIVPKNHVAVVENGHVRLDRKEGPHETGQNAKSWTGDKKQAASHTEAVTSGMGSAQQAALT